MRKQASWLLVALTVAACQAQPTPAARRPAVVPSPGPSLAPASPAATKAPAALLRPAGDRQELAGTIRLEAAYALAHGGAVRSTDGAALAFGTPLASGNAIAPDGGLALPASLGLLSNNGGSVISNNGSAVVANNGGTYGLLATDLADQLPAGGVAVRVLDLATGASLPLGQDEAGRPVYEVLADAAGGFKVYLPPADVATLRIVAAPVGQLDPRLHLDLLARPAGAPLALEEDAVAATRYLRATLAARYERDLLDVGQAGLDGRIQAAGQAAGARAWTPEARREAGYRMADALFAGLQLDTVPMQEGGLAMQAMIETLAAVRATAGKVIASHAADPDAFFATKAMVQAANARDHVTYHILRPADLSNFLVQGYLANANVPVQEGLATVVNMAQDPDFAELGERLPTFITASVAFTAAVGARELAGGDQDVLAALKAFTP